jgi:hypothetical protein
MYTRIHITFFIFYFFVGNLFFVKMEDEIFLFFLFIFLFFIFLWGIYFL